MIDQRTLFLFCLFSIEVLSLCFQRQVWPAGKQRVLVLQNVYPNKN